MEVICEGCGLDKTLEPSVQQRCCRIACNDCHYKSLYNGSTMKTGMRLVLGKAIVILSSMCDKVYIKTELPCPFVKNFLPSQPPLDIHFDATYDTGVQYVRDNFGIEPEVIDTREPARTNRKSW